MSVGEVDAFLGGWTPKQNPLIDPLKEKGFEKIDEEKVARQWIAANLDTVGKWLEGLEGPDGKPAIEAIQSEFK